MHSHAILEPVYAGDRACLQMRGDYSAGVLE